MSSGNPSKRTRADRVASIGRQPGPWSRLLTRLRSSHSLIRLAACLLAAAAMWAVTASWKPPFAFRRGDIPRRDVVARIEFSRPDPDQMESLRARKRSETVCIYAHDVRPLVEIREALKNRVFPLLAAESWEQLDPEVWSEFRRPGAAGDVPAEKPQQEQQFLAIREALEDDMELAKFQEALADALQPYERDGLLEKLHRSEDGSQTAILVHPVGNQEFLHRVEVEQAQVAEAMADLPQRLDKAFVKAYGASSDHQLLAELSHTWLARKRLPTTLKINEEASERARAEAVGSVEMPHKTYKPGDLLVRAGRPLQTTDLALLRLEYSSDVAAHSWGRRMRYSLAYLGMFAALYVLCGCYLFYHAPDVLRSRRRFLALLGLAVLTVAVSVLAAHDHWRAELVPLAMFGVTLSIVHRRELALLLAASAALIVTFSTGRGLADYVILVASVGAAVLPTTRIRSRTKLIYAGALAAAVGALTTLGVGTLTGQAFSSADLVSWPDWLPQPDGAGGFAVMLLQGAAWHGFCLLLAGLLMTALLPFIERLFAIQTDISLLELGDAAHPLLQELARRAPGTYNHSINVASLAESAAEAIGANGLLVRVGAYFHDIGKMLKPNYFIENQGQSGSQHESLVPAMSTLVIIAHVKDGADLARQHNLPKSFIDFIEQHHGTTLVEYFYRQAEKASEQDPNGEVDERSFRYPGPKPQTREAAVMMLADACESASRTLVEPAPSRIEHLVDEIAMKRLLDGQFDDCGLTLKELDKVKERLAKSLTAVYHGRVKYPDQQTA